MDGSISMAASNKEDCKVLHTTIVGDIHSTVQNLQVWPLFEIKKEKSFQ